MRLATAIITPTNHAAALALRCVARVVMRQRWEKLRSGLDAELRTIPTRHLGYLPAALICAEDVRFYKHRGIDLVGIARAIWKLARSKKIEGASTITQQLVRVYTGDYEVTLQRKLREILLAVLTDSRYPKGVQIELYLDRAYFGWKMNGIDQALRHLGIEYPPGLVEAAQVVARLKYPQPRHPSVQRSRLIADRINMIQRKISGGQVGIN